MQQDCSQNVVRPASGCSKMVVNTGISVLMAWQIGGSNVVRRCGVVKNVFSVIIAFLASTNFAQKIF